MKKINSIGLQVLIDELVNKSVFETYKGKLAEYFVEEAMEYRREKDKSYLNESDLEKVAKEAISKHIEDLKENRF